MGFRLGVGLGSQRAIGWTKRPLIPMGVHISNRYFVANERPVFLLGYYKWDTITPTTGWTNRPSYLAQIANAQANGLNYIRLSLDFAEGDLSENYTFKSAFRIVDGAYDLSQWNEAFWSDLVVLLDAAHMAGIIVHIAIFEGHGIKTKWADNHWNIDNQIEDFFGDIDANADDNAEVDGDFYQDSALTDGTGIGFYQKALVAKLIATIGTSRPNVILETGNELYASPSDWNTVLFNYIKTLCDYPVTQTRHAAGGFATGIEGHSRHDGDNVAAVKTLIAGAVGSGRPAWIDPDGSSLQTGSADDLRKCAWHSLAGGAAGWGGFTLQPFDTDDDFDANINTYFGNLMSFIETTGVPFATMVPNQGLLQAGTQATNSVLAKLGEHILVYVPGTGATLRVNTSSFTGDAKLVIYNPLNGLYSAEAEITGITDCVVTKPSGLTNNECVFYFSQKTGALAGGDLDAPGVAQFA